MANLNFDFNNHDEENLIMKVIGIGGGGSNAVNFMFNKGIVGVDFIVCNTDSQHLERCVTPKKIQIGTMLTGGHGVGGNPELGRKAAQESIEEIKNSIGKETKMLFIACGMGGGTGTGAAPLVAQLAKDMDILTVGIVTFPFKFEGEYKRKIAEEGIAEMKKYVDAIIIIQNQKIMEMYEKLSFSQAYAHADNVLATAAKGIAEIITVSGIMNVDFEDVKSVLRNSGTAIFGCGMAEGEDRALLAVQEAVTSPLLNDQNIQGAQNILLNISYGTNELTIDEIQTITDFICNEVGADVNLKFGNCPNDELGEKLAVTLIATALNSKSRKQEYRQSVKTATEIPVAQYVEERKKPAREKHSPPPGQLSISFDQKPIEEPYIKSQEEEIKLRNLNYSIKTQKGLEESENIPAFVRRQIQLEELPHSSDVELSKFILSDDGDNKPKLKEGNAYLTNNVD